MADDETRIYTVLDAAEITAATSTPAVRRGSTMDEQPEQRLMDDDFRFESRQRQSREWERPEETTSLPRILENIGGLLKSRPMQMKPSRFDGTGSLESFLAQFEVCARHNRWTETDKVDFLRCALEKAATQLLWDFGAQPDVSYEQLVERLRQRYGTEGQAETFRAQLYYRRQRTDESLSDLLHEIRRLVVLAYPVPSNETTQIIARDAFLEAMRDRELSLKVREREPKTLDEAYRTALRLEAYQRTTELDDRRRPPNRVRATQEIDTSSQIQAQLDRFLAKQREEQQNWQRALENKIDQRLREMRSQTPTNDDRSRAGRPGNSTEEATRRTMTCYNCGKAGHIARNCRQARRSNNRTNPTAAEAATPEEATVMNHTTRPRLPNRASNNAIFIRGTINEKTQMCLIDTGSEVSLVPSFVVEGVNLRPCHRFLMAANGSEIRVLGEVTVPLEVRPGFKLTTTFLVSDQITEPMMGMDWLRQHRCRLGFGSGSLYVGRRRLALIRGNGSMWCRRVIVAEEVEVSPKSQYDIPVRTLYGDLSTVAPAWMTEAKEIQPGVHLARVVVGDKADTTQVRVVNLNEGPVRFAKDLPLGGLHPVQVDRSTVSARDVGTLSEASPSEMLLADLPEEVPIDTRTQLEKLLLEYQDVFSVSEGDLGRTSVSTHKIDTGDARPVRQPLRRQPLPHRAAVDEQLDKMRNILYESAHVKTYWHQRDGLYLRDGVMYRKKPDGAEQVLMPKALREEFLKLAHTGVTGGHLGVRRTRWQVRRRAYWVGWSGEVKRFCKCCPQCNQYHRGKPPRQGPLQPLPCGEPWERLGVDITGPHPRSRRGNVYILTVMDYFTKFVEAIPMTNQEATTVAKALVDNVIVRYGAPLQILTDQGTNFDGNLFKELCKLLGIDKVRTSSYHPSGNGLIERFHRTLNAMLGKIVSSHQRDWDEMLPSVLAAYRSSLHDTTGFTPNFLLFGRELRAPLDLVYGRPPDADLANATYSSYVRDLADRMESAYRLVREQLQSAAERRKRTYDLRVRPKEFAKGQRVWYFTPRRYQGRTPKWQRLYTGPFLVVERSGAVNYRIQKTVNSQPFLVHVDKLRLCYDAESTTEREEVADQSRDDDVVSQRPKRARRRPIRFQ